MGEGRTVYSAAVANTATTLPQAMFPSFARKREREREKESKRHWWEEKKKKFAGTPIED
jgi:hypothetical protein